MGRITKPTLTVVILFNSLACSNTVIEKQGIPIFQKSFVKDLVLLNRCGEANYHSLPWAYFASNGVCDTIQYFIKTSSGSDNTNSSTLKCTVYVHVSTCNLISPKMVQLLLLTCGLPSYLVSVAYSYGLVIATTTRVTNTEAMPNRLY